MIKRIDKREYSKVALFVECDAFNLSLYKGNKPSIYFNRNDITVSVEPSSYIIH